MESWNLASRESQNFLRVVSSEFMECNFGSKEKRLSFKRDAKWVTSEGRSEERVLVVSEAVYGRLS